MRVDGARRGLALPVTLLFIVLMIGTTMAGFTRVRTEVRELDMYWAESEAFEVAEEGLAQYLARAGEHAADTTMALGDGTARIRATVVRPALAVGDSALYVIRSEGVVSGRDERMPVVTRTVTQLAYRIGRVRWRVISYARIDSRGTR